MKMNNNAMVIVVRILYLIQVYC